MKNIILVLLLAMGMSGCASSKLVQTGNDTYNISKQSATTYASGDAVIADLNVEAAKFCQEQGQEFQSVDTHHVDGVAGKTHSSAEVQFRCIGSKAERRRKANSIPDTKLNKDARDKGGVPENKPVDIYTELKKLKNLLDEKIITQEEFDAQKKKILSQ